MAVTLDELRFLPHHGIANRHRHRVIRLAAAGAARPAIDRRLPASARAVTGLGARSVAHRGRALTTARDWCAAATRVQPRARAAGLVCGPERKPERVARVGHPRAGDDRCRGLRERVLDREPPRRCIEARDRFGRDRDRGIRARRQRVGREQVVIATIFGRGRHQRAQIEPVRDRSLHAQARMFAHGLLGQVVEAPVRGACAALALRDRVAELVEHELRKRVVDVEDLVGADRDHPGGAGRVGVGRPADLESHPRGGRAPEVVDRRIGERAAPRFTHPAHLTMRRDPRARAGRPYAICTLQSRAEILTTLLPCPAMSAIFAV